MVRDMLKRGKFTDDEKAVLLCIIDGGGTPRQSLFETSNLNRNSITSAMSKAVKVGLIEIGPEITRLIPSLTEAIRYIIENEKAFDSKALGNSDAKAEVR